MSSALKSKLKSVYSSPFDEALSKPLIANDAGGNERTTSTSTSTSVYSNRLEMTETQHQQPQQPGSSLNYRPPLPDQQEQADSSLSLVTTNELNQMDINTALLQERHAESARVARSMQQIHDIQNDLADLVSSQQETIDNIENDAYDIHDNAERGVSHLEKAKSAMRDATRNEGFMRVFFAVMAGGGLMIAIVLLLEAFY
mmetsp:Transcript_4761/g.5493  ORF Transcript_4761/g.5493 Transcript_4761/m.5493 type:complete len:200 (-) Transcript_4761:225-824(-)|eukprot:CAMPEP_0204625592 /NCGR_PEP_ID=MMETSP0717-20131115/11348_1 /ASSEMBLY_ACC=CAM_ASM_000666 /TAXON_ID=230516 /ORGANISM="Chaetoceros curvisetus" /LENGTH=199 /DNA_ID=CAMNT_0051641343 /DNA_START=108 /DNA_END=707 /DNA_ORIENTATION=-